MPRSILHARNKILQPQPAMYSCTHIGLRICPTLQFSQEKKNVFGIIHQFTRLGDYRQRYHYLLEKALLLVKVSNITLIMFVELKCKHLSHGTADMHNLIAQEAPCPFTEHQRQTGFLLQSC